MQVCPKCGKQYDGTRLFCDCGARLALPGGDEDVVRQFRDEIARIRTSVVDRITALEGQRDQASLSAQRAAINLGGVAERRPDSELRALDSAAGGFDSFGDFIRTLNANPGDSRLQALNTRALEVQTGASGGFLVPTQWSDALVEAITYQSLVRPYARYAPRSDQQPDAAIEMPLLDYTAGRFGGVTVSWIGEGAAKPESQPTFGELTLKPNELAGYTELTDKLIRNVPGVSALLGGLFAQAIAATMDDAYLAGDGVAKPLGVIGHPATINVTRAGPGAVAYADFVNMVAASR